MAKGWKIFLLFSIMVIVGGSLLLILVQTVRLKNTGFETKTLWDWMELLIIPLFLAGGAFFLNRSERNTEREIATDRQQEAALQAYLDRMGELLLEKKLRTAKNNEVRNVARIRTLSVLRRLDSTRKGIVVKFLYEAGLINRENPIVDLGSGDLRDANLNSAGLVRANLRGANLAGAYISGQMRESDLSNANLIDAKLDWVNLASTDLRNSDLRRAVLKNVFLSGANLLGANLSNANLQATKVSNEQLATVSSLKGATINGKKHD